MTESEASCDPPIRLRTPASPNFWNLDLPHRGLRGPAPLQRSFHGTRSRTGLGIDVCMCHHAKYPAEGLWSDGCACPSQQHLLLHIALIAYTCPRSLQRVPSQPHAPETLQVLQAVVMACRLPPGKRYGTTAFAQVRAVDGR